jgi:hypothetical protein
MYQIVEDYQNNSLHRIYGIKVNKLPKRALKYEPHWNKEILDARREIDGTNYA